MKENGFTDVWSAATKWTLFQEEIDAMMTVMHEVLTLFDNCPNKGTIILDGQRKGEDAQCIMRMNLEGGVYRRQFFQAHEKSSEEWAESAIDTVLGWPMVFEYDYGYKADPKNFGEMPTGVYLDRPRFKALVLNTTFGRFIMSAQLALVKEFHENSQEKLIDCHYESIALMKGVAVALGKMCPKDLVLQKSVRKLKKDFSDLEETMKAEVDEMFNFCNLPALAAWKEWHDAEMEKGDLGLFFQE